ncbi:MAG: carboxylating nicotinate-nucleotide diphosphorylase [Gammaproteobacteria bacterium]|nr:carboxylating nicotinate-nucleotide diphosphorylase [Gammaproteobacteria bacterium]
MTTSPARPDTPADLGAQVRGALAEDLGSGDLTAALVPATQTAVARIITRQDAVLCGQAWVDEVFRQLEPAISLDWQAAEGARVTAGMQLCELRGPARPLLSGERTALNFLQTLSAVATATRRYVDAVAGTGTRILDTRKTLPGLRLAQKYAVRTGGACNHRIGLFDAILVKENHIIAAGSIAAAVATARRQSPGVLLEVEVENLAEAAQGFAAGADRLLLDNFSLADLAAAVDLRNASAPGISLEASGGITLDGIRAVAETGVDFISTGDITKNIQAVDLSMRFHFAG